MSNYRLELIELSNGYQIYREGFNGCSHINIFADTLEHALSIMEMILTRENSFNE